MKKEGNLPKNFGRMLKRLKGLDDELGISDPGKEYLLKEKKKRDRKRLLERIWDNWPRKTFLNKDVFQMRENALKSPEVKSILERRNTRIEDCALIDLAWDEEYVGKTWDCPADCSPENIRGIFTGGNWGNTFQSKCNYGWGSPRDQIKILFRRSNNNRFKVIGLIEMFQEKGKKTA